MTRLLFVAPRVLLATFRSFRALAVPSLAPLLSLTSGIRVSGTRSARPFEENGYLIFLPLFKLTQCVIIHRSVWSIIPSEEVCFFPTFSHTVTLSSSWRTRSVKPCEEDNRWSYSNAPSPIPDLKAASSSTFLANRWTKVPFKEERENTINQRKTWQIDDGAGMKQRSDQVILVASARQQEPGQSAPECIQILF